jgi:hypothetical protein
MSIAKAQTEARIKHSRPGILLQTETTTIHARCERNLYAAAARGEGDTLNGRVVNEPADPALTLEVDESAGQLVAFVRVEYLPHDFLLSAAGRDKRDLQSSLYDGEGEGDALGWGLGRVGNGQDPGVLFAQEIGAGEQATGVAVGTASKKEQVEERQLDAVACSENADQSLLVLVGQLLHVVEVLDVDGVHLGRAQLGGYLVQELLLHQLVVAVLVVERHGALVGVEDFPLVELHLSIALGLLQERLGERLGQRSARDGDAKDLMTFERRVLRIEDVGAQARGELIHVIERVQVRRFTHGGNGVHSKVRVFEEGWVGQQTSAFGGGE